MAQKKIIIFLISACLVLSAGIPSVAVAKKASQPDIGNVAVVIRGGDEIMYSFHRMKKGMWGGAVGGLVGALVTTDFRDKSKAAQKDHAKEKEINTMLGGWSAVPVFEESLKSGLSSRYKIEKVILHPEKSGKFKEVDRGFYLHGNSRYGRYDKVYDYTPLIKEGISTVIETGIGANLTAVSALAGSEAPILATYAVILDLNTKTAIADKGVQKGSKQRKYEEWIADNGALIKSVFENLAGQSGTKLAAKLNK